jgi:hypothetical protein
MIKSDKVVFSIFSSIIGTLFFAGIVLNFTTLKNKEIGFVKGKFSSVFQYNIPFSLKHEDDRKIVRWLKKNGISPNDYVIAGIKSNRYIPSNLDMPQDHFLSAFFFSYSHKEGFKKVSLDNYIHWISDNNPRFIIWDIDFQEEEYAQVINREKDERKISFSFDEFNTRLSNNYEIADTITKRIIVYRPVK